MDLLNDYDFTINYHPGKASKVADALSRKSAGNVAMLQGISKELVKEIVDFGLVIVSGKLSSLQVCPLILEGLKEAQHKDVELIKAREEAEKQISTDFKLVQMGLYYLRDASASLTSPRLRNNCLRKPTKHRIPFSLSVTKMYQDLKR